MPRRFVLGRPVARLAGIDAWCTALSVVLGLAEGRVRGGRRESRHVGRTIGASRMGESPATGPPVRRSARRAAPIASIAVSVLLLSALALAVARLLRRPGRPKPFLDADGRPFPGSISEKIRVTINGVEQGMFIKSKDVEQSRAALPPWRHARLLPDRALPHRSRRVLHRGLVGTARFRALLQRRHSTGDREPGAAGVRHAGGDRLPPRALRTGEDLPHGAFGGDLHRHPGGCTGPGAVPRLHRRGSDVASAQVRASWPTTTCSERFTDGRQREDGAQARSSTRHATRSHCRTRTSRCATWRCTASASARRTT